MNILVATMGLGLSLAEYTYIVTPSTTWQEAEDYCVSKGGHLASIHSTEEYHRVATFMGEHTTSSYPWLGGYSTPSNTPGTYKWSDGSAWDYTSPHWVRGNSHPNYLHLYRDWRWGLWCATCKSEGICAIPTGNYILSKTNCENDYEHITSVQECAIAAMSLGKVGGDFDVSDVFQYGDEKKTCLLNLSHGRTTVQLDGLREIGTIHQLTCSSNGFEGCFCKRKDDDKCASAHGKKACEAMDTCNWTRPQGAPERVCIRHTCTSAQKRVNCEAVGCSWFAETRTCSAWHLAPPGSVFCDKGVVASKSQCEAAVKSVAKAVGAKPGRGMQVGESTVCSNGGWERVPLGCSAQSGSGGDWAAHFKTDGPAECSSELYQLVCGPGREVTVTIGGSGYNSKTVFTTYPGLRCPPVVNRRNWVGGDTYPDQFEVSTSGSTVTVRRLDAPHGWGMNLRFTCSAGAEGRRLGVEDELIAPWKNITEAQLIAPEKNITQPAAAVEGSVVLPEA